MLAKATHGQFLLRIEDTDAKRTIPGAEEQLYKDLRWAGLQWDEGPIVGGPYGPYRQSERLSMYKSHVEQLLTKGKAYRCFCSSERIHELNRSRHEKGLRLGYDRKCFDIPPDQAEARAQNGEPHVVRFQSPERWPRYFDVVYGKSGHGSGKAKNLLVDEPVYEDVILIKSDGFPTYHWANVCDDHDMHITHVVRGSEWMASTPLHVALYESLDWTAPLYAHVPLLVDKDGRKLSKRNLEADIASYRDKGIFPEALLNFAALLGWSHTEKKDVMTLSQLESLFDMKITRGNTIVAFNKLDYLQAEHARRRRDTGGEEYEQMIRDLAVVLLDKYGARRILDFVAGRPLRDVLAMMLSTKSIHYRSARDFAEECSSFFDPTPPPLEKLTAASQEPLPLHSLRVAASTLCLTPESSWTEEVHRAQIYALETPSDKTSTDEQRAWKRDLFHYLRWALFRGGRGPSIPQVLTILGRQTSIERIQAANLLTRDLESSTNSRKALEKAKGFKGNADGFRRIQKDWKGYTL